MSFLEDDLDAMLGGLDPVEVAFEGGKTTGVLNDQEAEARLAGYPSETATRQLATWTLLIRRGTLPALEAKARPEGQLLTIGGASYRVQTMERVDDGRVLRLHVTRQ